MVPSQARLPTPGPNNIERGSRNELQAQQPGYLLLLIFIRAMSGFSPQNVERVTRGF